MKVTYLETKKDNESYKDKTLTLINETVENIQFLKKKIILILTNYKHWLDINDLHYFLKLSCVCIEIRDALRELLMEDKINACLYDPENKYKINNENNLNEKFTYIWTKCQYSLFKNTDNTETDNNYSVLGNK
jgi:hypothetical protein